MKTRKEKEEVVNKEYSPMFTPNGMKIISCLKGFLSAIIWGLGQLFNKQILKALFFFVFFISFIGIELATTNFNKINPYDQLNGNSYDAKGSFIKNTFSPRYREYKESYLNHLKSKPSENAEALEKFSKFEKKYGFKEIGKTSSKFNNDLTYDSLIKEVAFDIENSSKHYFTYLGFEETKNDLPKDINEIKDIMYQYNNEEYLYVDTEGKFYRLKTKDTSNGTVNTYYRSYLLNDSEYKDENGNVSPVRTSTAGLTRLAKTGEIYIQKQADLKGEKKVYIKVNPYNINGTTVDKENPRYYNLNNENDIFLNKVQFKGLGFTDKDVYKPTAPIKMHIKKDKDGKVIFKKAINYNKPEALYLSGTEIKYVQYSQSPLSYVMAKTIATLHTGKYTANQYSDYDKVRFISRVWFELSNNKAQKETFIKNYTGFFEQRAGLFLKAYWGLFTLGSVEKKELKSYKALNDALNFKESGHSVELDDVILAGNVSTILLLQSLIGVILSLFFLIFMIWSIKDAYNTSMKKFTSEEILTQKEYFVDVYEKNFEYIVLSPALFVIAFISIMPILFGFILAFTSIRGDYAMTGKFNYVGFTNFFAIFDKNSVIGQTFGQAFWRVLLWTFIWAIFSTLTVFFGGFFQALILNNRRVVFRKFWRTLLILPWAIPALLSQMIFKVFFSEIGYFNQILQTFGINDLLRSLGMLGQEYSVLEGAEKLFYLGNERVQWFSNPYNSAFVRTSLIFVNIWLGFPYFMALMTGIMTSIDKTLYEAADIDGATNFQKLTKITMPLVLSSTAPILVMTFSGNFNNFGVIYFITQGGPNQGIASRGFAGDTDILISWMYKLTVDYRVFNYASVFSILIFIFVGSISVYNLSKTKAFKGDN